MKFLKFATLAALFMTTAEGAQVTSQRLHHRHPHRHEYLSTLPDVRADTVSEADIAAHEAARAEAAKVKKNPQTALLATIKADLEQVNKDMSFGVSFSQSKRNDHARDLTKKVSDAIQAYSKKLLSKVESGANEALTEQNAHNIGAVIFYDVQLQDAMAGLGMPADEDLVLAINRLKSL